MSLHNKILATAGVLMLAGSFVATTPVAAQSTGVIDADSADVVFCEPRADGSFRYRGSRASFDNNNIIYIMPKGTLRLPNGDCDPTMVTQVLNIPAFSDHTTRFRVDLNGTAATIEDIVVTNTNPTFSSSRVCVAPGGTATFVTSDADGDRAEIVDIYDEVNDAMTDITFDSGLGRSQEIEVDAEEGFTGEVKFTVELRDEVMLTGGTVNPAITQGTAGTLITTVTGDATFDLPEDEAVKMQLTAVFSNSCATSSSSSMMSSMSSSSMMSSSMSSSSMMSSSASSMQYVSSSSSAMNMSSSSKSAHVMSTGPVTIYTPTVNVVTSAKGDLIRTGGVN